MSSFLDPREGNDLLSLANIGVGFEEHALKVTVRRCLGQVIKVLQQ